MRFQQNQASSRLPHLSLSALGLSYLAGWLFLLVGCNSQAAHHHVPVDRTERVYQGEYPIQVLCTIGQVAEMLSRVGGEHVQVEALMGPGIDPHLYRPKFSDLDRLNEADVIFYNGLHLEGRMTDLFVKMARSKPTFAVTEGLQDRQDKRLREPPDFEGMYDPHVWHDVQLWADCVHDVADMMAKFDPQHADEYDKNAHAYMDELLKLHEFCQTEINKIPSEIRVLVTAHDAFGYFGNAYGLEVVGLKGISSDDEIDLDHQEKVQKMLVERKIPAVFVESAITHRTMEALVEPSREAGLDLKIGGELFADALGEEGSPESSYRGMIRHNVKTIVDALSTSSE